MIEISFLNTICVPSHPEYERVTIQHATIKTGDDCISMGPGSKNVYIEDVTCGPGHGISIGSLGLDSVEDGVKNVVVKTWAKQSNGTVYNITFQDSTMINTSNPILIDQEYCTSEADCPGKGAASGVFISDVTYDNIHGSSGSQVAVKLDCSSYKPCQDITLKDIDLTYNGGEAQSSCAYASGKALGTVKPSVNCLSSS